MRAAIGAVSSALFLIVVATSSPASAMSRAGGEDLAFSVGNLSCASATGQTIVSSVNVSVLYVSTSDAQTGSYTWNEGTNYTTDPGLSGNLTVLLDVTPPPQCPSDGNVWLNWSNASEGSLLRVDIAFAPGISANGSGVYGNSTVTVSPPVPAFPYFLQLTGLGVFCVFLYWSIRSWRRAASLVDGEVPG